MLRWLTVAGILLLAALWWLWTPEPSTEPVPDGGSAAQPPLAMAAAAPDQAEDPLRVTLAPEPSESAQAPAAEHAAPLGIRIQGRCIAAEDGTPLAGIEVRVYGRPTPARRASDPVWVNPEPRPTAGDGRFFIELPPASDCMLTLDLQAPDWIRQRREWPPGLDDGTVLDLGEVALTRGVRVYGRLEDEHGQPVPNVHVRIQPDLQSGTNDADLGAIATRADAEGAFVFRSAASPGTWRFGSASAGCTIQSPESLRLTADADPVEVLVQVRMRAAIAGTVVDEKGAPIGGVTIKALEERGFQRESTSSREDGSFTLYQRESELPPAALELSGPAVSTLKLTGHYPWGSQGHRLQAERALATPIRVVERGSGAPIEHYGVRTTSNADYSGFSSLRHDGRHPDGRLLLDGVQREGTIVLVLPEDREIVPNRGAKVIGGAEETVIELERCQPFQVLVCFADGTPVAESVVRLFDQKPRVEGMWIDPFNASRSLENAAYFPRLLSEATSGPEGLLTLGIPPSEEDVHVTARGSHQPAGYDLIRPQTLEQPYRLIVSTGGVIRGTVLLPEGQAGKFTVLLETLHKNGVNRERAGPRQPEPLDADGGFRFEGLLPNTYWVHLTKRQKFQHPGGGSADVFWRCLEDPLAEILLAAGEERVLTLDASQFAFGGVEASFLVDGEVRSDAYTSLDRIPTRDLHRGWSMYGAFRTDAAGVVRCEELEPGRYRATILVENGAGGEVELKSENEVEVHAGDAARVEFIFRTRSIRLQFLDQETGAPLADRVCTLNCKSGIVPRDVLLDSYINMARTDAEGVIVFHGVLAGRYTVSVMGSGTTSISEEFEIPDQPPKEVVVLRATPIR